MQRARPHEVTALALDLDPWRERVVAAQLATGMLEIKMPAARRHDAPRQRQLAVLTLEPVERRVGAVAQVAVHHDHAA